MLEEIVSEEEKWAEETAGGWDASDERAAAEDLERSHYCGRQEAFQQRLFERDSFQTVFAVVDSGGL